MLNVGIKKKINLSFFFSSFIFEWLTSFFLILSIFQFYNLKLKYLAVLYLLYLFFFFKKRFKYSEFFKINRHTIFIICYFVFYNIFFILSKNFFSNVYIAAENILHLFFLLLLLTLFKKENINRVIKKTVKITICLLLVIFIQNFIIYDFYLFTTNIFLFVKNDNYSISSANTLSVYLNILLSILLFQFHHKNKTDYINLIFLTLVIILTFSRAGLILLCLNYFLILFNKKTIFVKLFLLLMLFLSLSFILQKDLKKLYLERKKINFQKALPHLQVPNYEFFRSEWFQQNKNKSDRGRYIFIVLNAFKERPFLGYGINSFPTLNKETDIHGNTIRYPDPHNTFLLILYEYGLIGLIFFLYLILKRHFSFLKKKILFDLSMINFTIILSFSLFFINLFYVFFLWFFLSLKFKR